jgi:hypothetical protein
MTAAKLEMTKTATRRSFGSASLWERVDSGSVADMPSVRIDREDRAGLRTTQGGRCS